MKFVLKTIVVRTFHGKTHHSICSVVFFGVLPTESIEKYLLLNHVSHNLRRGIKLCSSLFYIWFHWICCLSLYNRLIIFMRQKNVSLEYSVVFLFQHLWYRKVSLYLLPTASFRHPHQNIRYVSLCLCDVFASLIFVAIESRWPFVSFILIDINGFTIFPEMFGWAMNWDNHCSLGRSVQFSRCVCVWVCVCLSPIFLSKSNCM